MWSKTAAQRFSLAFLVTAVLCARVFWAQEFVTDGLIGFWTLDKETIKGKTVSDVWGENHAQITGGNPKTVEGRINDALL